MLHIKDYEEFKKTTVFFNLQPSQACFSFLIAVCVSLLVLILWSSFSQMDDVVKASVILRPKEAVSSIRCASGGELSEKFYRNNESVEEGSLLLQLDSSAFLAEKEEYDERLARTQKDISVAKTLLETIRTEKFPLVQKDSDEYITSAAYLYENEKYETVEEDSYTKLKREKEKPETIKIPQDIQDLQNQYDQNKFEFDTWKNTRAVQANNNYNQLISTKNGIESHIAELERTIRNTTIYAPISGCILEVKKVNCGDYIFAGEEIIRIIPDDNKSLIADIYVDPSYIAKVKIGNPVKIKFPGLPPSRYGQIETEISLMPPDATLSENGQPVFVVEADIKNSYLTAKNGTRANLIPGITAEARIVTERSTVMQMILRKLDFIN
jgi:multidrug resistance efflux pump